MDPGKAFRGCFPFKNGVTLSQCKTSKLAYGKSKEVGQGTHLSAHNGL